MSIKKLFGISALALCLTACSNAADNQNTNSSNQSQNNTTEKSAETKTNTETKKSETTTKNNNGEIFTNLETTFTNNGYTILDKEIENREIDFNANNNQGTIDVSAEVYSSLDNANHNYEDDIKPDTDTTVTETISYKNGEATILLDNEDNEYEVEAIDKENNVTYSFDNVSADNLDSIKSLLELIGFSK